MREKFNAHSLGVLAKTILLVAAVFASSVYADAPPVEFAGDSRYCRSTPERDASGLIKRNRAVLREFAAIHPCPSSGLPKPSCAGWKIDHPIPLACGGCDQVHNLQWLPDEIKSCAGTLCKDRWERKIYCRKSNQ